MMVYSLFMFHLRRHLMNSRASGGYDDPMGPTTLTAILIVTVLWLWLTPQSGQPPGTHAISTSLELRGIVW